MQGVRPVLVPTTTTTISSALNRIAQLSDPEFLVSSKSPLKAAADYLLLFEFYPLDAIAGVKPDETAYNHRNKDANNMLCMVYWDGNSDVDGEEYKYVRECEELGDTIVKDAGESRKKCKSSTGTMQANPNL